MSLEQKTKKFYSFKLEDFIPIYGMYSHRKRVFDGYTKMIDEGTNKNISQLEMTKAGLFGAVITFYNIASLISSWYLIHNLTR